MPENLNREIKRAYQVAKRFCLTTNLNGYCLEASVTMAAHLNRRRYPTQLIRRLIKNDPNNGHWTIEIAGKEYDPTCADWPDAPTDSKPGTLYEIKKGSPQFKWRRTDVNEAYAYQLTGIELRAVRPRSKERPTAPRKKSQTPQA